MEFGFANASRKVVGEKFEKDECWVILTYRRRRGLVCGGFTLAGRADVIVCGEEEVSVVSQSPFGVIRRFAVCGCTVQGVASLN